MEQHPSTCKHTSDLRFRLALFGAPQLCSICNAPIEFRSAWSLPVLALQISVCAIAIVGFSFHPQPAWFIAAFVIALVLQALVWFSFPLCAVSANAIQWRNRLQVFGAIALLALGAGLWLWLGLSHAL
jgi:hypothetical protein